MKKILRAEFCYDGWLDPKFEKALDKVMKEFGWKNVGSGQWVVKGEEKRDISYEKKGEK